MAPGPAAFKALFEKKCFRAVFPASLLEVETLRRKEENFLFKMATGTGQETEELKEERDREGVTQKSLNTQKVQDLCHVFVECPKFIDTRLKDLNNLIRLNKFELYFPDKVNIEKI